GVMTTTPETSAYLNDVPWRIRWRASPTDTLRHAHETRPSRPRMLGLKAMGTRDASVRPSSAAARGTSFTWSRAGSARRGRGAPVLSYATGDWAGAAAAANPRASVASTIRTTLRIGIL